LTVEAHPYPSDTARAGSSIAQTLEGSARRYPIGVEVSADGAASFRVWAPAHTHVAVVFENGAPEFELEREPDGYFSRIRADTPAGTRYRYRLGDDATLRPDPGSRFQPHGPAGVSQIVDPRSFGWTDHGWPGVAERNRVVYEMHIGTFTREGTWAAAARELKWLADLGITVVELMPVCEFPGSFGWGYDLVHYFAPTRLYGTPDDMRAFVNEAHRCGIAVILDVVYNHCATSGCFLPAFTPRYFSERHKNDWGHALNFDGAQSAPVREFFVVNADFWISEFHIDGYRLDATQQMFDDSPTHVLAEICARVRQAAAQKKVWIVAENEPQDVQLLAPRDAGGFEIDALWNDDFHHSARVAVTGRNEAYYTDYTGSPQELVSAAKYGFLYQGQYYAWQKQGRGTSSLALAPQHLVAYIQNHDQIANSARGVRLHELTSPGRWRAITALLLLAPAAPMLFQGQEFAASAPFVYFADTDPAVVQAVRDGRREFVEQFASIAAEGHVWLTDPDARNTFERCKLDLSERDTHHAAVALHRDLLKLRREDPVFSAERADGLDGAVIGPEAFVLRFFSADGDDRLLVVNLGRALEATMAEPLLAPPQSAAWRVAWSSEAPRYGGDGTPEVDWTLRWKLPGHVAVVLTAA
jgi:maltooligosyltrehalose trehalohydrolase